MMRVAGCGVRVAGASIADCGFQIADCKELKRRVAGVGIEHGA